MLLYDPTERILPKDALRHPFLQRENGGHVEVAQSAVAMGNAPRAPGLQPPAPSEAWAPQAAASTASQRAIQGGNGNDTATMEGVEDQPPSTSDGTSDAQSDRVTRVAKLQQQRRNGDE